MVDTKAAKWTCPECGKVSRSWYIFSGHVTIHKGSCDKPWICRLPPMDMTKKKYVQLADGSLICGNRCSTKHNLAKHFKTLHTARGIVDLTSSVKTQSASSSLNVSHRLASLPIMASHSVTTNSHSGTAATE